MGVDINHECVSGEMPRSEYGITNDTSPEPRIRDLLGGIGLLPNQHRLSRTYYAISRRLGPGVRAHAVSFSAQSSTV
jgi:hypothetical protein